MYDDKETIKYSLFQQKTVQKRCAFSSYLLPYNGFLFDVDCCLLQIDSVIFPDPGFTSLGMVPLQLRHNLSHLPIQDSHSSHLCELSEFKQYLTTALSYLMISLYQSAQSRCNNQFIGQKVCCKRGLVMALLDIMVRYQSFDQEP